MPSTAKGSRAGWCSKCQYVKTKKWRAEHPEQHRALKASYRARVKIECFAHYGGHCQCCGEAEIAFLALDHVNNDGGGRDRGHNGGTRLYAQLRRAGWPTGYQVLCFNCNFAKSQVGGCPHQR